MTIFCNLFMTPSADVDEKVANGVHYFQMQNPEYSLLRTSRLPSLLCSNTPHRLQNIACSSDWEQ
jgi:hypothetical protein